MVEGVGPWIRRTGTTDAGSAGTNWTPYTPTIVDPAGDELVEDFGTGGYQEGEYRAETSPDGSLTVDVRCFYFFPDDVDWLFTFESLWILLPDLAQPAKAAVGSYHVRSETDGTENAKDLGTVHMINGENAMRLYRSTDLSPAQASTSGLADGDNTRLMVAIRYRTDGDKVCETFNDQDEDVLNVSQPYVPGSTTVRSTATGDSSDPLTVTWTEGSGPQEYDESDPATGEITLIGSRADPTGRVVVCYTPDV